MTTNPLDCSLEFNAAHFFSVISQSLQAPRPVAYWFAAVTSPLVLFSTRLLDTLFIPSISVYRLAGSNPNTLRKISWLAPTVGIPILTLAGRATYEAMPNSFLKGAVFGLHTSAIGLLTNIPNGDWAGMITLRKVLGSWIQLPSALGPLTQKGLKNTDKRSETFASATFLISSFGLSFFKGVHTITANTIGHVAAAATKVITARVFARFAEKNIDQYA